MRLPTPTPTERPMPIDRYPDVHASAHLPPDLNVTPAAIAAFDALVHELHPDAVRVDITRLRRIAGWLADMPREQAHQEIDARLLRLHELCSMATDPDWECDPAVRKRLELLCAYVDRDDDMIPDRIPLLGHLDDVLLIELAWPAFVEEVEDYRDFCAYRSHEHPNGDAAGKRAAWIRDRLDELALIERRLRVHEYHYAPAFHPADTPFKVF